MRQRPSFCEGEGFEHRLEDARIILGKCGRSAQKHNHIGAALMVAGQDDHVQGHSFNSHVILAPLPCLAADGLRSSGRIGFRKRNILLLRGDYLTLDDIAIGERACRLSLLDAYRCRRVWQCVDIDVVVATGLLLLWLNRPCLRIVHAVSRTRAAKLLEMSSRGWYCAICRRA